MKILFLCLAIFGCTKSDVTPAEPKITDLDKLKAKYAEKFEETKSWQDGWPSKSDCDALLWAGLARASGVAVTLSLAEYPEPGQMQRRPEKSCFPGESASTISRDMILGYFWAIWVTHDWPALERFAARTNDKKGVIGEPYPEAIGEVLFNPNMYGLMGRMQCNGHGNCPGYRDFPAVSVKSEKDYVRHLSALYIILNQMVRDGVLTNIVANPFDPPASDLEILKWQAENWPDDALFQFAFHAYDDGDFSKVIDLLLSPQYQYPSYVRGAETYKLVHWLFVSSLVLAKFD